MKNFLFARHLADANDAITKKLEVVEILRSGSTAIVVTNSIHALGVGDTIQIIGCNETDYNKTTTVQEIIDSTSFTYEVSNDPRSPATPTNNRIEIKTGSSPSSQATAFQVQFSQSMNTSTISVANASHFIYANGTTTTTGYNKTHATIQLSDDNFATSIPLIFAVEPERQLGLISDAITSVIIKPKFKCIITSSKSSERRSIVIHIKIITT